MSENKYLAVPINESGFHPALEWSAVCGRDTFEEDPDKFVSLRSEDHRFNFVITDECIALRLVQEILEQIRKNRNKPVKLQITARVTVAALHIEELTDAENQTLFARFCERQEAAFKSRAPR
jgi:hypothetical protein